MGTIYSDKCSVKLPRQQAVVFVELSRSSVYNILDFASGSCNAVWVCNTELDLVVCCNQGEREGDTTELPFNLHVCEFGLVA